MPVLAPGKRGARLPIKMTTGGPSAAVTPLKPNMSDPTSKVSNGGTQKPGMTGKPGVSCLPGKRNNC
jgi:hypothetical protein